MRLAGLGAVGLVLASACTFGSIASYDVAQCNPKADEQYAGAGGTIADDCDRLNEGSTTSCNPWQCDPTTSRCVRRPRDDDRDGDPLTACGGGDCDDTDPALNSLRVPAPTIVAALSLDPPPVSPPTLSYDGFAPMLAFTAGTCLTVASAEVQASLVGPCTAGVSRTVPTQPYAVALPSGGFAAAFVATSGCAIGAAGLAYVPGNGTADEVDRVGACENGVALPALAALESGAGALAYYATPAPAFDDPSDACPLARAAPLVVGSIADLTQPALGKRATLSESALSIGPPALRWQSSTLFVASPDAGAVTIWALDGTLATTATGAVPALMNALAVVIDAHPNADGTTRLAIVAQIGCAGQTIHVALVDYDPTDAAFSPLADSELSSSLTGFQSSPSLAWSAARGRWLTTWVANGPKVMAQFFDDTAKPSEPGFEVASGGFGAVALANAHVAFLSTEPTGDALLDSAGRCP